jgi:hypothetical protein
VAEISQEESLRFGLFAMGTSLWFGLLGFATEVGVTALE